MSGWCIEAVRRLPGERPRETIARVMAGGLEIRLTEHGPEMRSLPSVDRRPIGVVSTRERRWMLDAVQALQRLDGSFVITAQERKPKRRWPCRVLVESETAPMWVSIDHQAATMRHLRRAASTQDADAEWNYWWRCARAFAKIDCVIWEPDGDEIVATSVSSSAARERYRWM